METNFTKGDWELVKFGDGYGVWGDNSGDTCVLEVKTNFTNENYESEMVANVHLMKTSPKMYKMLEEIAISMECFHGVDTESIFELLAEARGE